MPSIWLIVLLYFAVAVACFSIAIALLVRPATTGERVASMLGQVVPRSRRSLPNVNQILQYFGRLLPRSAAGTSRVRSMLVQAGKRDEAYVAAFYGGQAILLIVVLGLLIVSRQALRSPFLLLVGVAFAILVPKLALKRMARKRQHAIQLALPDALDLATICVEAGLGLNGSLARIAEEMRFSHPELSEEFGLVNLEMRAGKARSDALRNLAERTGVEDVRSLVAVLIQTDRFGTSVANTLRVYSDSLRSERRQRAEEAAAKTTIKLVPILVLFVLPALFCVTIGPAVLQLVRTVLPALRGQ